MQKKNPPETYFSRTERLGPAALELDEPLETLGKGT